MTGPLATYLRHILNAPLTITAAEVWHRPRGMVGNETIVWFPKVLLVRRGCLQYQIEDRTLRIPAGHILYRPAWTRSRWRSTQAPLDMAFCEFDLAVTGAVWREPLVVPAADPAREANVMRRIADLYRQNEPVGILEAAGELKAMLARIFCTASRSTDPLAVHPRSSAIDAALAHVDAHFASPDVLAELHRLADMGINRFREAFRQQLGLSPQQYVLLLRMRAARYHVADARLPLKQVCRMVGYDDPLYFSRVYRRFWGHPPTHDRHLAATGARPPTPY